MQSEGVSPNIFRAFRREAEPGGERLLALNLPDKLVVGFHRSRLGIGLAAVQ
jgi:hypothetical protein